jgi:hypothetical protein
VIPRPASLWGAAIALLGAAAVAPCAYGQTSLRFAVAGPQSGLVAPTWCGGVEKPHILESGGGGLALFDYDGDGDLDLYLVNGWRLDGPTVREKGRNVLYRNRGDGSFEDVTERAGVGDDGWGTGVAVGDVDGDGLPDLWVSNFGPDVLYRNRGDGSFEPLADPPGIDGWSTGAAFFDADGDGDQDLFLGGYIECTLTEVLEAEPELDWEGLKVMLGPFGLEGLANRYFENLGGGRFAEATKAKGLADVGLFYTFAIVALDLDGDRDLDLYAANDSNPNYLYRNDGGTFSEVGLWSGAALDAMGNAQAGMGLATGDLDNDGLVDLFVTNFAEDFSTLYRNLGDFLFTDATRDLGIGQSTYSALSWGSELIDFDLDGDLDLFVANGHIYPQADRAPLAGTSFRQPNLLLENRGAAFVDVSAEAGEGLAVEESSRGVAAGDVDGDGDVDLAIWNMDAPPTLLLNESRRAGDWMIVDAPATLQARLDGEKNRQFRHRVYGGSYVSVDDARYHFGISTGRAVASLTLVWPDGRSRVLRNPPANVVLRVSP